MYKILIIAHGTQKAETDDLEFIVKELANLLNKKVYDVQYAYLKYGNPSVDEVISSLKEENIKKIIIHPFFLSSGIHVAFDIPKIIERIQKEYPNIEVFCTKPLGKSKELVYIIKNLIEEVHQTKKEKH